jgi:hypothetical protein
MTDAAHRSAIRQPEGRSPPEGYAGRLMRGGDDEERERR